MSYWYWLCRSSPKQRAVAKVASETHRGIGADRASGVEDVGDPAGWHADIERQAVRRKTARRKFALQQPSRMRNRRHGASLSVMPGLVPGIHVFLPAGKTWMAGSSPAMTK